MKQDQYSQIRFNGFRGISPGLIAALIGIFAIGLSPWRTLPALAQPPASTQECVLRVLNQILRNGGNASLADVQKICGISGLALAAVEPNPSTAPRNTASVALVPDRLDSVPLPKAEPDVNPPPASAPVSAQPGPTTQKPPGTYAGGGVSVRTSGSPRIAQIPAAAATVNVKDFGASGSDNSYTCSIEARSTTLTCTTPTDFQVGQYVAIPTAGIATPLTPAGMPTITNLGTPGSTTDCYEIVAGDPAEGLTAPSPPGCITNGPAAPFSTISGLTVSIFKNGNLNTAYGIYRSIDGSPYILVNVTNGYTYNDYGGDISSSYDWPAVKPSARSQTLYATVIARSGTTWTLGAAAASPAIAVKVRHDDTVAIQSAYDAAFGSQVYFPAGTYHINMILFLRGSTRIGYAFDTATAAYNAVGSILESGSSITTTGDSTSNTTIQRDWAWMSNVRGVVWNVAPALWFGYTGPQASDGTPTLQDYALNNAAHGVLSVTTHSKKDVSNFHVGDIVYITGGQAVNGNYSASNLTEVRTVDPATGAIGIADPLTIDIPWGIGYSPFIEDLTSNNVAQASITFENMTVRTPTTPVSINDTYGATWQTIYMPQTQTFSSELFYNEWSARVNIQNNSLLSLDFFEFPLSSYLTLSGNTWYIGQRGKNAFAVNGASTPLQVVNNSFVFPCGGGFGLEGTIAKADIEHNQFDTLCVGGGTTNGSSTVTFGVSKGNSLGYSWIFSNNVVYTNSSRAIAVNSHNAMPPSTVVSNNVIDWEPNAVASVGIGVASPAQLIGNTLNVRGATVIAAAAAISLLAIPGQKPPLSEGNNVSITGGQASVCFDVIDPGSIYSDYIIISGNVCTNTQLGITVASSLNTPNVSFLGNTIVDAGIAYSKVCLRAPKP